MNKHLLPMGIIFLILGIALIIIFRDSTPGTGGGILLVIVAIGSIIKRAMSKT